MDKIEKKLDVLFELEKYEEVLKLGYENLYATEIDKELLYQYIILSHMNLEEYHKALQMCDEALKEYPSSSAYLYLRSKTLYYLSSYKKALVDIEKALSLSPNEARYLALYAQILLMQDRYTQAKEVIEKALELESNESEYRLIMATVLYLLDDKKATREIVDDVLAKEPHNLQALDLKQKYFTSKLKEKKSILQNLLFLDPFDKASQKDIKFIKYYYRFLPPLMALILFLSYLLQSARSEFGFLEPVCFVGFAILGTLGSKDWRLNVPFIAVTMSFDAYYNHGDTGIGFKELFYVAFMTLLLQFVFRGIALLFRSLKLIYEEKHRQQQNSGKNLAIYFLFVAPFEKHKTVDTVKMKRYYIETALTIPATLLGIYIYTYHYPSLELKIALVLLFAYSAFRAYRVFWILVLYIFAIIAITDDFQCDRCVGTLIASIFAATIFAIPYNITRRFSWTKE